MDTVASSVEQGPPAQADGELRGEQREAEACVGDRAYAGACGGRGEENDTEFPEMISSDWRWHVDDPDGADLRGFIHHGCILYLSCRACRDISRSA